MLPQTEEKLLINQLLDIVRKKEFDPFEKAEVVNQLIFLRRSKCMRCCKKITKAKVTADKGPNVRFWCKICAKVPEVLGQQLGVSRVEIYRIRALVDAHEKTKEYVRTGKISPERVTRIINNLKKQNKRREVEIVEKAIEENMSTREIEEYIAELNTPRLVLEHCKSDLLKANNLLKKVLRKIPKNGWEDIDVRVRIDRCRSLSDDIEKKAKVVNR